VQLCHSKGSSRLLQQFFVFTYVPLEARAHGNFLSKVWWNFPKQEQNESNLQKKKNSKIFPFFSEKNKICHKKITGHHKVIIHLQ
jgi:hypothetical protein